MPRRSVASGAKWSRANLLFGRYTTHAQRGQMWPIDANYASRGRYFSKNCNGRVVPRPFAPSLPPSLAHSTPSSNAAISPILLNITITYAWNAAYNFRKTYSRKNCAQSLRQCSAAMRDLVSRARERAVVFIKNARHEGGKEGRIGLTRHSFIIAAFNITRERAARFNPLDAIV